MEEHDVFAFNSGLLASILLSKLDHFCHQYGELLILFQWKFQKNICNVMRLHEYSHGHVFELCYSYLPNSMGDLATNN